jgi:endoglucanase
MRPASYRTFTWVLAAAALGLLVLTLVVTSLPEAAEQSRESATQPDGTAATSPMKPSIAGTANDGPGSPVASLETPGPEPLGAGPLRADGGRLVDAAGRDVRLTGVNWFGLETGTFAPHGLWARNLDDMLDQIVRAGFNTIRLPYSNQLFEPASKPNGIDYQKNPDLQGLSGPELMDQVIQRAGSRGLKVILDRHRPTADAQSELWYTDRVSEDRWIGDWVMLASHYRGNPTVIGADLHNEPHGPATWGDGNPGTDWRLAAERAGNAVLQACPDWLIFVEGIEHEGDDWYWWGGNLAQAKQFPVRLSAPDKLVYEAHDYGPAVSQQKWFRTPDFPANLTDLWWQHWAYLKLESIAPVLVGEFGGRSVGQDAEGVWQRSLLSYLHQNGIDYTYWSWNPNSGDTGGILQDDWSTLDRAKLSILAAYQWPLLDPPDLQAPNRRSAGQSVVSAYQWPPAPAQSSPPVSASPSEARPTTEPSLEGAAASASGMLVAIGGPFDPDPRHALAGIGGPDDPDPVHRQARERDERRYVEQLGAPWPQAVYAAR